MNEQAAIQTLRNMLDQLSLEVRVRDTTTETNYWAIQPGVDLTAPISGTSNIIEGFQGSGPGTRNRYLETIGAAGWQSPTHAFEPIVTTATVGTSQRFQNGDISASHLSQIDDLGVALAANGMWLSVNNWAPTLPTTGSGYQYRVIDGRRPANDPRLPLVEPLWHGMDGTWYEENTLGPGAGVFQTGGGIGFGGPNLLSSVGAFSAATYTDENLDEQWNETNYNFAYWQGATGSAVLPTSTTGRGGAAFEAGSATFGPDGAYVPGLNGGTLSWGASVTLGSFTATQVHDLMYNVAAVEPTGPSPSSGTSHMYGHSRDSATSLYVSWDYARDWGQDDVNERVRNPYGQVDRDGAQVYLPVYSYTWGRVPLNAYLSQGAFQHC